MAKVGAQRAAELTGKSKSTIQRAMNAGKLSFEVDANSRRLVDVSELERVFGIQPQTGDGAAGPEGAAPAAVAAMEIELERARHAIEVERLKMEVRMANDQLDIALRQIEDLKVQRDLWQKQAQQILITSQYSQKQSEERIAELREREEARARAMEAKKLQGTPGQPARIQPPARPQGAVQGHAQPASSSAQGGGSTQGGQPAPVFRTVQPGNQNRNAAAPAATGRPSLFASLFGKKKA